MMVVRLMGVEKTCWMQWRWCCGAVVGCRMVVIEKSLWMMVVEVGKEAERVSDDGKKSPSRLTVPSFHRIPKSGRVLLENPAALKQNLIDMAHSSHLSIFV